jgi:hypothetical protein
MGASGECMMAQHRSCRNKLWCDCDCHRLPKTLKMRRQVPTVARAWT